MAGDVKILKVLKAAEKYKMNPATLYRWLKRYKQIGEKLIRLTKWVKLKPVKELIMKWSRKLLCDSWSSWRI